MGQGVTRYGANIDGGADERHTRGPTGTTYYDTDMRSLLVADASKQLVPPARLVPSRIELTHIAGWRGKPGVNADILSATEATRMIVDPMFELLGVNAVSGSSSFNAEGGIDLATAGADADSVILAPHLDANLSPWTRYTWGTDKQVVWQCRLATKTDIDHCAIWAGLKLTNTPVTATDDNQVFFRYENGVNSGAWQAIYSIGGTDSVNDSGVVVAASTTYELALAIDADRVARMFIDNALVATSTALTDATDLIPYVGVLADGEEAAKTITYYGQHISRQAG